MFIFLSKLIFFNFNLILIKINFKKMALSNLNHKKCFYRRDLFCYLCGEYVQLKERVNFNTEINLKNFFLCYGYYPELSQSYKPSSIHDNCRKNLSNFIKNREKCRLKFSKPAVWKKPRSDHSNCFVCHSANASKDTMYLLRNKNNIVYLKNSNIDLPELNEDENDDCLCKFDFKEEDYNSEDEVPDTFSDCDESDDEFSDRSYVFKSNEKIEKKPTVLNQEEFSDLLKLINVTSSEHAQLLASFFKKLGYTDSEFRISYYADYILDLQDFLACDGSGTAYISDL
jgi:hypothetical protein